MRQVDSKIDMTAFKSPLTKVICWTRMQAESGQDIRSIIARKELERRCGDGLFFWGVGNAPSRSIRSLLLEGDNIDVVFSLMKTKPKARDVAPSGVLAWQTYFDVDGVESPLPSHVIVTSRMEIASGVKRSHYALICRSDVELRLDDQGPFDPSVYRNLGVVGGAISHSQVTALAVRTGIESQMSDYRINLRARLAESYWVKLGRPWILGEEAQLALATASAHATTMDWLKIVAEIRPISASATKEQSFLF